ncbi:MAG TPA: hypothetical protein VIK62_02830, partial [Verrucomicrobiae bacterium]
KTNTENQKGSVTAHFAFEPTAFPKPCRHDSLPEWRTTTAFASVPSAGAVRRIGLLWAGETVATRQNGLNCRFSATATSQKLIANGHFSQKSEVLAVATRPIGVATCPKPVAGDQRPSQVARDPSQPVR